MTEVRVLVQFRCAGIRCAGQAVGRGTRRRCCRFSGQDGSATLSLPTQGECASYPAEATAAAAGCDYRPLDCGYCGGGCGSGCGPHLSRGGASFCGGADVCGALRCGHVRTVRQTTNLVLRSLRALGRRHGECGSRDHGGHRSVRRPKH